MINKSKIHELETHFPLLAVENGCILSKDADVTIAYEVTLPEIFTVSGTEYEEMNSLWHKAIKTLPKYTIVHKQDWFVRESYKPDFTKAGEEDESVAFLSRAADLHFAERPYLNHKCYLYITKTTKKRIANQSTMTTLCRSKIIPQEISDPESVEQFLDAVTQFERILNDGDLFSVRRLSDDEITGTDETKGLLDRYLSLSMSADDPMMLEDIKLGAGVTKVGNKSLCCFTISTADDLPEQVKTDIRYERMSTEKSSCNLSMAAPIGLLLYCDHIYNQYLVIGDSDAALAELESRARWFHSLSRFGRNGANYEWIASYLNEAHTYGVKPIKAHFNVLAWSDDPQELRKIRNDVGAALSQVGITPRHNIIDTATLWWSGMPGNEADLPSEETYYTFIAPAICLFTQETNYRDSLSPFGIRMTDRLTGKPIHVDISDLPMKEGITVNRNKFVLGPSGSGKSFFMNHLVRQYYEQGTHILLVDTGNSYEGLANLIRTQTKGKDGVYYTYTEDHPITFNPFYTDDYVFDIEKKESLLTLLTTLWKSSSEPIKKTEASELYSALTLYLDKITNDRNVRPCFNTFYEFLVDEYREDLRTRPIPVDRYTFDIDNLLVALAPYYKGGAYDYLLNSEENIDLLSKRFIVFEIDAIKDNKTLFPVVTIIIMEAFINKMRRLQGIRKMIVIEEAWKAIASANMADYIKYLYKTVRKFFGEAIVVTQEVDDIIQSPVVKETIINNSDCKILLDQRQYLYKFDHIQELLGLTEKEKGQILSINLGNQVYEGRNPFKEVFFSLGGRRSAVYATEVSTEEYLTYTTEEREKIKVKERAAQLGGDLQRAIRQLAMENQENQ